MEFKLIFILFLTSAPIVLSNSRKNLNVNLNNHPFDNKLYEEVLDPELCQQQVQYLTYNNTLLRAQFLDAGIRLPKGILTGNRIDMGNYYQCLNIRHNVNEMNFQGKYCIIQVSLNEETHKAERTQSTFIEQQRFHAGLNFIKDIEEISKGLNETDLKRVHASLKLMYSADSDLDRMGPDSPLSNLDLTLAVCIPAACTTKEGINNVLVNISELGLHLKEDFCRLPNDKLWAPIDTVASVIFSFIGIITCLSTCYDIYYSRILKEDKRNTNSLYFSCSVYTNARRLVTFTSAPNSLDCIDGIRALAMIWVILGHSFYAIPTFQNPIEAFQWSISPNALWMTTGHITVDTFFLLSGLLVVYSTAGKLTGGKLLRGLHKFYLNRLLRMFPILAAMTLFEASLYNYVSDGPFWRGPASNVIRCRQYWWSTLLHVQNFVNPRSLCVGVTWYLSLDVQLHILSPIILYWVLSTRKQAWAALAAGLLSALTASTVYIFYNQFPSGIISPNRTDEMGDYFVYYYINVLTRAPPFFVGMIFGYLLHLWKGKKLEAAKVISLFFWGVSFALLSLILYCMYINTQLDWNNQIADSFINSFIRPLWAASLGWIIFACAKGYGGPINWFLSLHIWKLPARLSYAMYIIHFSVMTVYYHSNVAPKYFDVPSIIFNFFAFSLLTFVLAFVATVVIDSPFSIFVKVLLQTGTSKPIKAVEKENVKETISPSADLKNFKGSIKNPAFVPDEEDKSIYAR